MRRKLTYVKIADMCKRHTELKVLVCCLSCVRKITIYDGLEDHERVSCTPAAKLSSLCHFGIETIRVLQFACHKVIVWRLVNPLGWQTNSCMKISNVYLHVINKKYNHYGMLSIILSNLLTLSSHLVGTLCSTHFLPFSFSVLAYPT